MKVYQGLSELQLKIQLFQDIIKKVIFIKRRRKMAEYKLLKTEGRAKRAEFHTVHGTIQTPVFMNVGTIGAIKGAVSTMDLQQIGTQVELSNTYHLHVRPGDKIVKQLGGLHKFMVWDKPILTDSGGFQVFSLAKLRKIKEEGVYFNSHIDGHKIFMGPEESMESTRVLFMKISVLSMPKRSLKWIWMAMLSAVWQLEKPMKRCTGSWMR